MKCRPKSGAVRADAARHPGGNAAGFSGFQPVIRCSASHKAGIVFDCEGIVEFVPRSPGGRDAGEASAAAANFKKRGVVSYRFRKIEESIL